jgi:CNT family concentrative nucleoside transporter
VHHRLGPPGRLSNFSSPAFLLMLPRFQSLLGVLVILGLAWLLSARRKEIVWRTVVLGLSAQFAIALISLRTRAGGAFFLAANQVMDQLNQFALKGALIPFGFLARTDVMKVIAKRLEDSVAMDKGVIFAVSLPASLILVSTLSALFYHWGILQRVVQVMAWVMRKSMRTSGSESLAAAANTFLGQDESALVIKPYLEGMTRSEIMALMTIGMATIATGMVVLYSSWGLPAGHLITASMMSAPGALLIAKIMLPETEPSDTAGKDTALVPRATFNTFDAACRGALDGMKLSLNILAIVIAFVALVALANSILVGVQGWCGISRPQSFQDLMGYLNAPLAWLIGVPWHDCQKVGSLMGIRIVLNEFLAYDSLVKQGAGLDPRSFLLATYALCGFANFSSIAIQIGGIGTLAPGRRRYLAELGLRAMVGGVLSCYLSAAIIGIIA